jgi:hypothetical protein
MISKKDVMMDPMFVIRMHRNTRVLSDYAQYQNKD